MAQTGFEVALIKPSDPTARGFSVLVSKGGRIELRNMSLKRLLAAAYSMQDFQVTGGPNWIDAERYDITAKAEGDGSPSEHELFKMLQPLLAERFHVELHRETKQMARYVLTIGKGGSKLTEVKADGPPALDIRSRHMITSHRAPLSELVEALSWLLDRVVIDETSLKGVYDFKLEWSPDDFQAKEPGAPTGDSPAEGGNSLEAAIQDQLGLKLVPQKGPVEMLVVDRAQKPAGN